jgi:hypothetical protein
MSTGPKRACTFKYTCFQAPTSVLGDELTTKPAIHPAFSTRVQRNRIKPDRPSNQLPRQTCFRFHACEETNTSAFQHLTHFTSFALLCFSTDATHRAFATATNSQLHQPEESKTQPRDGTKANAMLSRAGHKARASEKTVPASA